MRELPQFIQCNTKKAWIGHVTPGTIEGKETVNCHDIESGFKLRKPATISDRTTFTTTSLMFFAECNIFAPTSPKTFNANLVADCIQRQFNFETRNPKKKPGIFFTSADSLYS